MLRAGGRSTRLRVELVYMGLPSTANVLNASSHMRSNALRQAIQRLTKPLVRNYN